MESISARLKVSPATSPYSSSFLVPRGTSLCSWIITLQALWFFAAPLGTWEGHLCSSFLVFHGTSLELSQSHISYAALPEDPKPLAASGYPGPVLSLDFAGFFNGIFARNLKTNRALMLILLATWIGPSLLFMEWTFLWNFGLQQAYRGSSKTTVIGYLIGMAIFPRPA